MPSEDVLGRGERLDAEEADGEVRLGEGPDGMRRASPGGRACARCRPRRRAGRRSRRARRGRARGWSLARGRRRGRPGRRRDVVHQREPPGELRNTPDPARRGREGHLQALAVVGLHHAAEVERAEARLEPPAPSRLRATRTRRARRDPMEQRAAANRCRRRPIRFYGAERGEFKKAGLFLVIDAIRPSFTVHVKMTSSVWANSQRRSHSEMGEIHHLCTSAGVTLDSPRALRATRASDS